MCLKRVEKKKLLGCHNLHLQDDCLVTFKNTEAVTGGVL